MGALFAIAAGGALGSIVRYIISKVVQTKVGAEFPAGTLFINIAGAFLIGFSHFL